MRARLFLLLLIGCNREPTPPIAVPVAATTAPPPPPVAPRHAGDTCTDKKLALCEDKTKILECHEGTLQAMSCNGPRGCRSDDGRHASCDFSTAAEGDACLENDTLCSPDAKTMVSCKEGRIAHLPCRGATGCTETPTDATCDTSVMVAGEACEGDDVACTADFGTFLHCRAGTMAVAESCRGPKKCYVLGRKIGCDPGEQHAGEACANDGNYDCDGAKKNLLHCVADHWVVDQKCKRKCFADDHEAGCK